MDNDRLAELRDKYKNRNIMTELTWCAYYNHQGYTTKQNAEFLNWLGNVAYRRIKELEDNQRPKGTWIIVTDKHGDNVKCPFCNKEVAGTDLNFCVKCGADMRGEN